MIQANELRLGNYVNAKKNRFAEGYIEVESIDFEHINLSFRSYDIEDLIPIPITQEWLLKLGFERLPNTMTYNYASKCGSVSVFKMPNGKFFADGFIKDVKLESVHQIQNLYFALTGEELSC